MGQSCRCRHAGTSRKEPRESHGAILAKSAERVARKNNTVSLSEAHSTHFAHSGCKLRGVQGSRETTFKVP